MRDKRRNETGMALVLALLSLMLLTFLGLALAASTSTELQIANNYRWSQQAYYNAEAGMDVARNVLTGVSWDTVLPTTRIGVDWYGFPLSGTIGDPPPAAFGPTTGRDYEGWACDYKGHGMGYGKVLNDGAIAYANLGTYQAQTLRGAFTIWVRRAVVPELNGTRYTGKFVDSADTATDGIVVTTEGVAPYVNTAPKDQTGVVQVQSLAPQNQAVRMMEAVVTSAPTSSACAGSGGGQTGLTSEGANFSTCYVVNSATIKQALGIKTPGDIAKNDNVR